MPRVVYVGPFDQVDVPALRAGGVKPGDAIEVSDADAEALLLQAENWAPEGSPEAKAAAARVAAAAKPAPTKSAPAPAGQEG